MGKTSTTFPRCVLYQRLIWSYVKTVQSAFPFERNRGRCTLLFAWSEIIMWILGSKDAIKLVRLTRKISPQSSMIFYINLDQRFVDRSATVSPQIGIPSQELVPLSIVTPNQILRLIRVIIRSFLKAIRNIPLQKERAGTQRKTFFMD